MQACFLEADLNLIINLNICDILLYNVQHTDNENRHSFENQQYLQIQRFRTVQWEEKKLMLLILNELNRVLCRKNT